MRASSVSSSCRWRTRLPRWVVAQFAVIRYSQVVNWASPRKCFRPSIGPQVRLLHHVACILLVAGQPVGERVRVGVGGPDQLLERVLVAASGGGHQLVEVDVA